MLSKRLWITIVFLCGSVLSTEIVGALDDSYGHQQEDQRDRDAQKIVGFVSQCLRITYGLDECATEAVLQKCAPLVQRSEYHQILKEFVKLSVMHVSLNKISDLGQEPFAVDDPVTAAPRYHEVLGENERVRVLYGYSEPGDVEPWHRHQWPSILLEMSPGFFDVTYADGKREQVEAEIGVCFLPADDQSALYVNCGKTSCSFLRFEIK